MNFSAQVVGTISRKDLMGFSIEERLERLLINPPRKLSRSVVLALKKNYGHKKSRGGGGDKGGPENNNLNGGGGGSGGGNGEENGDSNVVGCSSSTS